MPAAYFTCGIMRDHYCLPNHKSFDEICKFSTKTGAQWEIYIISERRLTTSWGCSVEEMNIKMASETYTHGCHCHCRIWTGKNQAVELGRKVGESARAWADSHCKIRWRGAKCQGADGMKSCPPCSLARQQKPGPGSLWWWGQGQGCCSLPTRPHQSDGS